MDDVLLKKVREAATEFLPAFGVLAAYAYGSRVSGGFRVDSDLDVGCYLRGYREGARLGLRDELILADRLSQFVGLDVDLRDVSRAPLEIRGTLLEEGVRIFEGDFFERVELEADLLSRYHDYKPEFEEHRRLRLQRLVDLGGVETVVVVPPKVVQLLEHLAQYVHALERLAALPRDELLVDQDKVASAKYHFVVAIEVCIDVGNHVIAAGGFRAPLDNADTFAVLCENGLLPRSDLEKYRAMARFRNRLVHLYWEVDDSLVAEYLQSSVGDLQRFARTIAGEVESPDRAL